MKKIFLVASVFALVFVLSPKSNYTTSTINYDDMVAENQRLAIDFEEDRDKIIQNEKSMQQKIEQYQSDREKTIEQEADIQKKIDEIYNQINSIPKK